MRSRVDIITLALGATLLVIGFALHLVALSAASAWGEDERQDRRDALAAIGLAVLAMAVVGAGARMLP